MHIHYYIMENFMVSKFFAAYVYCYTNRLYIAHCVLLHCCLVYKIFIFCLSIVYGKYCILYLCVCVHINK